MTAGTRQQGYVVAVDVGGTCTDCVVVQEGEPIRFGKALSTPPRFALGVLDAVRVTAAGMGLELPKLLANTRLFLHGSTVVDNAIFTRQGARTGLITTAGFEDTLLVTRGAYGRWSGQPEEAIKHPVASNRPPPLVPRARIAGVRERVDYKGTCVQPLDERDVEAAVEQLSGQGTGRSHRRVPALVVSQFRARAAHPRRSSPDWRRTSTSRSQRKWHRRPANTNAPPPP